MVVGIESEEVVDASRLDRERAVQAGEAGKWHRVAPTESSTCWAGKELSFQAAIPGPIPVVLPMPLELMCTVIARNAG